MIKMIACIDAEGGIGKNNRLLTHLPKDLEHFKNTTKGHICIFGRTTFESLPKKPLPNRKTVILTNDKSYKYLGCNVVHQIKDILQMAKSNNIYICGGQKIYNQFIPFADELIITHLEESYDADTFFPQIREDEWIPYSCESEFESFGIVKYKRR